MSSTKDSSYVLQKAQETQMAKSLPSVIARPESIDCLRHQRMFDALTSKLVRLFPDASWLTIGDGRFGSDTIFLKRAGAKTVHTTSLTDEALKEAKTKGLIESFSVENAENLSFPDNSFDFVLCKESYHHFLRPPVALYEMLRVAKVGVVLIEPNRVAFAPVGFLKTLFKRISGRKVYGNYEPSGNYIYRLSLNEVYHIARAIDLPALAWTFFNDFYHPRFFKAEKKSFKEDFAFSLVIAVQNFLSWCRLLSPGAISCVLLKQDLKEGIVRSLKNDGVRFRALDRNPYLRQG